MDELSQFKFAPPELIAHERRLLLNADVVFARGRKMAESNAVSTPTCIFMDVAWTSPILASAHGVHLDA
jgi:hypothetical protein